MNESKQGTKRTGDKLKRKFLQCFLFSNFDFTEERARGILIPADRPSVQMLR